MSTHDEVPARVRRLVQGAVRPPGEAIPNGCSDEDLRGFEERVGIRLPSSVRAWLRFTNGPCIGPGGMLGIRPERENQDIEGVLGLFPEWRLQGWIPLAGDGCGNYYVVDVAAGAMVRFVDSMEDPAVGQPMADDIWAFLEAVLEADQEQ